MSLFIKEQLIHIFGDIFNFNFLISINHYQKIYYFKSEENTGQTYFFAKYTYLSMIFLILIKI